MATWANVQYRYPLTKGNLDRFLLWLSADTRCYFAVKENFDDTWIYFAGNGSHAFTTQFQLTLQADEATAQTNYLTTERNQEGLIALRLPSLQPIGYARVYINDEYPATLYELYIDEYGLTEDACSRFALMMGA